MLKNKDILIDVTNFKIKFYNDNWAKYSEVLNGNIRIIPPQFRLIELKADYESMKEMIVDFTPDFDSIIDSLTQLEVILKSL